MKIRKLTEIQCFPPKIYYQFECKIYGKIMVFDVFLKLHILGPISPIWEV